MYWNCFFVFKNSCNCRPVHVWLMMATIFAAIIFLWSLSMTLFLPICCYDLRGTNSERAQDNGDNIGTVHARMERRLPRGSSSPADKLTIRKLQQNISELSKELHQLKLTNKIYEKLGKVMEKDSSLTTFGNKLHQNVLITSVPHSGGVFLGELFNRNPQVFYLFEPFHSLRYFRENRPAEIYESMVSSFLQGICNCDFARFKHYTDFLSLQYRALVYRLSSRTLSSPPLCPEATGGRYYNIRLCAFLRPPTLSAICKLHAYTFIKTSQIVDLERLAELTNPEGTAEYPFRVVELMRDPRAIVHISLREEGSRNVTDDFFTKESRKICRQQLRNIRFAHTAQSTLADRYTMVKYEDIISDPFNTLGKLYGFLGISMTSRNRSWLTNVLSNGFSWPAVVLGDGTPSGQNRGENLTKSITDWKTGLTESQIRLVEKECGEVMTLLGYKTF